MLQVIPNHEKNTFLIAVLKPYPWKKFHFLLIIGPRNTIFGNESPETHFKHHRGGPLTFQNYLLIGFGKMKKFQVLFEKME